MDNKIGASMESLTLDDALLRAHKSLSNILNPSDSAIQTTIPTNDILRSVDGEQKHHAHHHHHRHHHHHHHHHRPRSPSQRISFLDWSPSLSASSSECGDDSLYPSSSESGLDDQHYHARSNSIVSTLSEPDNLPREGPTTSSFWLVSDPEANPLARVGAEDPLPEEDVDIVVIGSGITGVSFLLKMVQEIAKNPAASTKGIKIVMLEARDFCSGATGRNGGHLTPLIFDDFVERSSYPIPNPVGDAVRVSRLEQYTLNAMASLVAEHGWAEDVDFVQNGHIKLLLNDAEEAASRKDYEAAKKAGVPVSDVRWIDKEEMKKENGADHPGVWLPAINVWPIKLVTKMFRLAQDIATASSSAASPPVSIRLFTHTTATSVTSVSDDALNTHVRWKVETSRGHIRTRYAIHATNAYASHLLPQFAPPRPASSSVVSPAIPQHEHQLSPESLAPVRESLIPDVSISKKPRAAWIAPTRGQIIGTRATVSPDKLWKSSWLANWRHELWYPRYWFPRPPSKNARDEKALVIMGGARDCAGGALDMGVTDDSTVNSHVSKALCEFLPKTFPGLFEEGAEPEYEWTGIMGYTKTFDPIVGPVPTPGLTGSYLAGQYIAAGYSGHGMPRAYACAEVIAQMILADMRGQEWEIPHWMPPSYLTI